MYDYFRGLDLKVSIPTFWKTPTTGETNPMYDISSSEGGVYNVLLVVDNSKINKKHVLS